jgi:hypothetical protein
MLAAVMLATLTAVMPATLMVVAPPRVAPVAPLQVAPVAPPRVAPVPVVLVATAVPQVATVAPVAAPQVAKVVPVLPVATVATVAMVAAPRVATAVPRSDRHAALALMAFGRRGRVSSASTFTRADPRGSPRSVPLSGPACRSAILLWLTPLAASAMGTSSQSAVPRQPMSTKPAVNYRASPRALPCATHSPITKQARPKLRALERSPKPLHGGPMHWSSSPAVPCIPRADNRHSDAPLCYIRSHACSLSQPRSSSRHRRGGPALLTGFCGCNRRRHFQGRRNHRAAGDTPWDPNGTTEPSSAPTGVSVGSARSVRPWTPAVERPCDRQRELCQPPGRRKAR